MKHGVYQIRNLINNKRYIGSAAGKGFRNRWDLHIAQLYKGKHHSCHLQNAWNKYGPDNFVFEIIELCKPTVCIEREQYYLDTLLFASCSDNRFYQLGYNTCRIAGSPLGVKRSEVTKTKISMAKRGKKLSQEHKTKLSIAARGNKNRLGHTPSEKTKRKLSHALQGEKSHTAKLTESNVNEIHDLLEMGITPKVIAQKFGVTRATISNIKTKKTWSHISS